MLLIASIVCCNLLVVRRLHRAGQSAWGRVRSRTLTSTVLTHSDARPSHSQAPAEDQDPQQEQQPASRWRLLRTLPALLRWSRPENAKAAKQSLEQQHPEGPPLIRRFSRNCNRLRTARALQHSESVDSATHEETAFAKLMGFLCVLFVLCWLPQMVGKTCCSVSTRGARGGGRLSFVSKLLANTHRSGC